MIVAALLLFAYMTYEIYFGYFLGALLSLVVAFLALALAFRYHFWFFQIKQRRLGCSVSEWFNQTVWRRS
jgi:intracellular multiplication protein IcmV